MLYKERSRIIKALLPLYRCSRPVHRPLSAFVKTGSRVFKVWQVSISFYAILAGAVCIVNTGSIIWASVSFSTVNGVTTLLQGDCSTVSQWDTWIHLAINILSILLLGGSNYTMQCLAAPTRAEIDESHSKASWLDIGTPSVRNLTRIHWKRSVTWLLLALSSVPLALM